jgi:glycerol dehydrogenase
MELIIRAPMRYVQFPGALDQTGRYIGEMGRRVLVVCTDGSKKRFGARLDKSLAASGKQACCSSFSGACTLRSVEKATEEYKASGCDMIAGVGGGQTIDTARAAANALGAPLLSLPTVASNDAPCSALSILHDEAGAVAEIRVTKRNPDLVLVDTEIIAQSPPRLLSAGMGDALSTFFEARACKASGARNMAGGQCGETALTLARLCYDTLLRCGETALRDAGRKTVTPALEQVVHANIFLSGVGFESGGVAASHAVNDGFSTVPESSRLYHGEIVGFGVLTQLMLEHAPENELSEVLDFMTRVNLPVSFAQLGMEKPSDALLRSVSEAACASPVMKCMPFPVSPEDVRRAMLAADAAGTAFLAQKKTDAPN